MLAFAGGVLASAVAATARASVEVVWLGVETVGLGAAAVARRVRRAAPSLSRRRSRSPGA